jgi:hypothetical protein
MALGMTADDQPRAPGPGPVSDPVVPTRLDEGIWFDVGGTVAATRGDHFVIGWAVQPFNDPFGFPTPPEVQLREVNVFAVPTGPVVRALPEGRDYFGQDSPALAANALGRLLVAFHTTDNPLIGAPSECLRHVRAQAFASGCEAGGDALCVQGGRFELSLAWADPRRGIGGVGHPIRLTDDTVYFWFFAPGNVEVVVKVLDGRAVNGRFWVFYGGLTDLGFTLLVRDTATGESRAFASPAGTMASRGVTDAFPLPAAAAAATVVRGEASGEFELHPLRSWELVRDGFAAAPEAGSTVAASSRAVRATTRAGRFTDPQSAAGPCSPPELPVVPRPGLCLEGRRFEVEVSWRDFANRTGSGEGAQLGDDSGYFWFFAPSNVELVVKVLDGRPINGKFWVFYGALTNVEYDLRVRHVLGNGEASYHNPSGQLASRGDVDALTPPRDCACPAVIVPVCGADGRTYNNACEAECFGWVEVAGNGPCLPGG